MVSISARMSVLFLTVFSNLVFSQTSSMQDPQLDSLFSSYFKSNEPGAAVILVKDNTIIYEKGFGIADINTKEPITPRTLFNLGSISKTFVSYGILKLVEEKKISLQDPLTKFFPDFKNPQLAEKVKLYHLMTHSSGLPDNRKVSEQREFYLVAKDEENFAPLKATEKLEFEPGSKYKYSNPAFNGLALVIEKTSGKKWQDYIDKKIFKPSRMKHSTITDGPQPTTGVAHAYEKNKIGGFDELDYGEEPTFAAAGNGGVWSSVSELWKYEQAIQSHKFLNKFSLDQSRSIYPLANWKDSIPSRLGLSWFLTQEQGVKIIGHTGTQGGFYSDYCWLPDQKLLYILLCNSPKPRAEIRDKVFGILRQKGIQ